MLLSYLPEIVRYISTVHNLCCLRHLPSISTNIGFRLVASDGEILYDPNFEHYNKDIVTKVITQMTQNMVFNTKLLNAFEEKFAASGAGVKVNNIILISACKLNTM